MNIDVISAPLDDFWPGVFALGLGGHVRPPRGTAGLVDWRMGGALSGMILSGQITGAVGEKALVWSNRRNSKVYLFGMGRRLPLSADQTVALAGRILPSLVKAGEKQVMLIPDPILHGPGGKGAEGAFLEGILLAHSQAAIPDEFRLIVPAKEHKAGEIHEGFRRAILRIGDQAMIVNLSMIEPHFALQH